MQPLAERYTFDRVIRRAISIVTFLAVILLLRYLSDVLVPFAVALLIAYLLNPLVTAAEKFVKHRGVAVLLTLAAMLAAGVLAVILLVPMIGTQAADFQRLLGELRREHAAPVTSTADTAQPAPSLADRVDALIEAAPHESVKWLLTKLKQLVTSKEFDLRGHLLAAAKRLVPGVWDAVTGALSFLLGLSALIVVLLYVVFLLNDFRHVERTWRELLPPAYRDTVVQFLDEFRLAMSRYFRGQFVISAVTGLLLAAGFSLIGLRMAIPLGLGIGLLSMVPYLQAVGLIPATLLAILRALERDTTLLASLGLMLAVFLVTQIIQDTLLTPRIMGRATGLRPAIILLGVFIWGKVLGFLGLVLAIPLTCLGLAYYRRFVLGRPDPASTEPTTTT